MTPYHGTVGANIVCATDSCVPARGQSSRGSTFLKALADDGTSTDMSYTSGYSLTYDLAFPQSPQVGDAGGQRAAGVSRLASLCGNLHRTGHAGHPAALMSHELVSDKASWPTMCAVVFTARTAASGSRVGSGE